MKAFYLFAFSFFVLTAVGCGGPSNVLTGEVKVDGTPLKSGSISLSSKDGDSQAFGAEIVDGSFKIEKLPEGTFVAIVTAGVGSNKGAGDSEEESKRIREQQQSGQGSENAAEQLSYYQLVKNAEGNRKEIQINNGENTVTIELTTGE